MVRLTFAAAVAGALVWSATAIAAPAPEPFGQETVETRAPRSPPKARPGAHRHDHGLDEHGHVHRPGEAHAHHEGDGHAHGIETENLFGFTLGSDTDHAGAKAVAVEIVGRFGKRGSYAAIGQKLEFGYAITDDLSVAFGVFADYHRIKGVPDLDDVRFFGFNGLGGEVRWRLLRRGQYPIGVTIHIEPSWQTHDELTGIRAVKYGSENKLIFDAELIKEQLFAAFNILYDVERVRERGSDEWEKGSLFGFAAAATYQVMPNTFVGAELRYLRAYEGLTLKTFTGDAVFVGPTLFARIGENAWIAIAWNVQVWGKGVGGSRHLNLADFERHHVRIKAGMEF
jgi:hypothetical protein